MTPRSPYPSDISDARWALIEPILAEWRKARIDRRPTGIPAPTDLRAIFNAILYVNRTGIAWKYLPHDFPPHGTVYSYYATWRDEGIYARLGYELTGLARVKEGRKPGPPAAVIATQHLTYPVYLSRLRAYPAGKYLPPAKGEPYPRGVAEAIALSIDTVTAAKPTTLAGLCRDLLNIISLLSPDGISRDVLYLGESAGVFAATSEQLDEAVARLTSASLLPFTGSPGGSGDATATSGPAWV